MSETRIITVKGDPSIFRVGDSSASNAKMTRRRARTIAANTTNTSNTIFTKIGGDVAPATASASSPASAPATANSANLAAAPAAQAAAEPATAAATAGTAAKVVLGGKKPKAMKVLLTKKNHGPADTPAPLQSKKHRKVTLGIQHLKRRVTKARRLNKMTTTLSINQIRNELIAGKIIKENSKAPEAILRQMYADAKLITTKSL